MEDNKHWLAPWHLVKTFECLVVKDSTHQDVARVANLDKKNANLIVHAPEVFIALEALYKSVVKEVVAQGAGYSEKDLMCLPEFNDAHKIIKKIKGE